MKYLCFFISCYKKNNNENKQNLLEKEIQNYEINNLINNESNNECFICLEPYKNNTCIKINCCNILIHKKCFNEWCKTKNKLLCPICNKKIINQV